MAQELKSLKSLTRRHQTVTLIKKSALHIFFFPGHLVSVQLKINFHFVPFSSTHRLSRSSSEEDNEDDEEDDKDEKDLDHQPAVGRDWLEVFEDLCVGALHVQLGVLNVGVDPVREWQEKGKQMMS